ncbi:MAG: TetR family transcriptional regulator [Enterocloster sp.]
MADSNITKRALAAALKELMAEMPFTKINISDICDKCNMNRKSFYYHFQDKYALLNWIYDTEFIAIARKKTYDSGWQFLFDICSYFYDNRIFYRKALLIKGQNSFSEHFRELMLPVIAEYLKSIFSEQELLPFHINRLSESLSLYSSGF